MADVAARVAIVNEHMRLENAHDFPACIGTFHQARYEVLPTAEVYDGPEAVDGFLEQNRSAFPDFVFTPTRVMGGADAVLVEGRFVGTHLGTWRGLFATGRRVDFPMALVFEFDDDKMVNERVYFDLNSPLRQLGVADDPNGLRFKATLACTHPFTIFKTLLRKVSPFKRRPPKRQPAGADAPGAPDAPESSG